MVKGTPLGGLAGATLGFFVGFAAVSLFGPTVGYLQSSIGISAGLLVSIPNLTGSLLRIPFSAMVDSDGGRRPFLILLIASAVGVAGIWILLRFFSGSLGQLFPLLLVLGALGGCGIATFSVGISQTSFWFPLEKQGTALGAYAGFGNLAPGILALLLGLFLPSIGLNGTYLAWFGFLVVGIIVYAVLGRNAPYFQLRRSGMTEGEAKTVASLQHGQTLFPRGNAVKSLVESAKIWKTWPLVMMYFTTFGGFIALTAWFPLYWRTFFDMDLAAAGMLTAVFSISASLIRVGGGVVSDRLGGEWTAFGALLFIAAGAGMMMSASTPAAAVTGIALLAVGMGFGNAAVFKMVPQHVPTAISGAAGLVGGLGAFGGFVIPNLMGLFVSEGVVGDPGFSKGFVIFIILAAFSLMLLLALKLMSATKPREVNI